MVEIDGAFGEGGGQILRTSVALSALTGQPVKVTNIRAGRENPGLRPQHLKAVEAVGLMCGAEVSGLTLGSTELSFNPHEIRPGKYKVDVGTAGSVTLVLQAMLPVALAAEGDTVMEFTGGTDVEWSPTAEYFSNIHCFFLNEIGCDVEAEVLKRGFYPTGGGRIQVRVGQWGECFKLNLVERGSLEHVEVVSQATETLRRQEVAERQVKGFLKRISPNYKVEGIGRGYVDATSSGSTFFAQAVFENTRLGVCALGRRGLRAEDVGSCAAEALVAEMDSNAPLDSHMADQILPYLAVVGGEVKVSRLTEHAKTNMCIINKFGYSLMEENGIIKSGDF